MARLQITKEKYLILKQKLEDKNSNIIGFIVFENEVYHISYIKYLVELLKGLYETNRQSKD